MGGYGSGRLGYGHSKRITVEKCRHLEVRGLHREGLLKEGLARSASITWRNVWGEEQTSIELGTSAEQVVLTYSLSNRDRDPEQIEYAVPVIWTDCHFGGQRPWLLCPERNCGRRVGKLYLPPGGRYFLCRHCYGLSYKSRQTWNKQAAFYRKHPELALAALRDRRAGHVMAAVKASLKGL